MGQFLAVGLTTEINISKSELKKAELDTKQVQEKMKEDFFFVPEIYSVNESDDQYFFRLKDDILHQQLIPFLKEIYPFLYNNADSPYFKYVLKDLASMEPGQWLKWAKDKPEEAFQGDGYGSRDRIESSGSRQVWINYYSVILSMEGKIAMEAYGRQFNFFKYTMMQTFKQYSIAGALRVYITG